MSEDTLETNFQETTEQAKKPIFDRLIQAYDQSIVNNPNWLSVADCEKVFGMGDRTIRNYAKKYNWQKKYAKVDGTPIVFFGKADVYKALKELGLIDGSKIENATLSMANSEAGSGNIAENALERPSAIGSESQIDQQSFPVPMRKALEGAISLHKEALTELNQTKDKLIVSEKSRITWKTNAFWSIGIAVISISTLGVLFMNFSKNTLELTKSYNDLNSKYQDTQSSLVKAEQDALAKEQEALAKEDMLMKMQTNAQGKR